MKTCNPLALAHAIVLSALLVSPVVHGQGQDQAAARSLFDEARKLMKAGEYADACPKLEAASKLYATGGILLNLADCHEKVGRTASAWTEFGDAAAAAARSNRTDQVREAKHRQAAVEPKLARLAVRVPHEVAGLTIKRDGADLPSAAWGAPIPVDPGAHEVRAEAAGREPWSTSVTVSTPGQTISIDVPELTALPEARASAAPATATPAEGAPNPFAVRSSEGAPPPSRSHALDWALIGGGAALGLAGTALMLVEAYRAQDGRDTNSPDEYNSALTPWRIGLGSTIVGGVVVASGIVLLAASHGDAPATPTGVRASPWVGTRAGGVRLEGAW